MYFWNVNKLVDDFRNDKVTEYEKMKYMVVTGILFTIVTEIPVLVEINYSIADAVFFTMSIILIVWGTYHCYKRNRAGDNKDFITRFMCVGLPAAIRFFVVFFTIVIIISFIEGIFDINILAGDAEIENNTTSFTEVIFLSVAQLLYYQYLGEKLRIIGIPGDTGQELEPNNPS